ncbi:MAG TPA: NAD-dependent epimerase/dehydratase family protein [Planctomycetota bacterium]|nr:NAD-dependent epimerase/dehydratase family protein [Planctomycetota bacterium]
MAETPVSQASESTAPLCLVTGASGFVGSHLIDELAARGYRVRALVRKSSNLRWLRNADPELAYGDVTDPESLPAALDGVQYVFHAAGVVKAISRAAYMRVNADGTDALLRACNGAGPLKRIVLVSSLAAGGPSGRGPAVDEDDPPRPISFYGESKLKAEQIALSYSGRLPITIIRPPAIYGPRDTEVLDYIRCAARFRMAFIAGRPDARLSVINVRDVVSGMILSAMSEKSVGRTYYLAGPEVVTWVDVAAALGEVLHCKLRRICLPITVTRVGALLSEFYSFITRKPALFNRQKVREILADGWVCSIERARREIGFDPKIGIREGMAQTVAWYRENGWMK